MKMKTGITISLCSLIATTYSLVSNSPLLESKIIGGEPVHEGLFRFMVSLQVFGKHMFGGALIAPKVVLTGAHCIYIMHGLGNDGWKNATVFAPLDQSLDWGSTHDINFAIVNPFFLLTDSLETSDYDIGVILLKQEIDEYLASTVKPYYTPVRSQTYVALPGWGSSQIEDVSRTQSEATMSNVLNNINVRIRGIDYCRRFFRYANFDHYQTCAQVLSESQKTNWGDSGSPLVYARQVIGVASGVIGASPALPVRFVKVSSFQDELKYIFEFAQNWVGGLCNEGIISHDVIVNGVFVRRIFLKIV